MNIRSWLGRYGRSTEQRYSGRSRFTQNGYPRKPVDQCARDWRRRKGFRRDQAKSSCWCKLGPYLKGVDHRSRRAYEREMLGARRWDELTDHREMFVSKWDAC